MAGKALTPRYQLIALAQINSISQLPSSSIKQRVFFWKFKFSKLKQEQTGFLRNTDNLSLQNISGKMSYKIMRH